MNESKIHQVRELLVRRILKQDIYDELAVHQWCIDARNGLVRDEVPCGEADKTVLAAVIGAVNRHQLESIRSALLWSDPPPPMWKVEAQQRLIEAVRQAYGDFDGVSLNPDQIDHVTNVFNESLSTIMNEGGVSKRLAKEALNESIKTAFPDAFVDKVILE